MTVPVLFATESWYCPNCRFEETIPRVAGPHTRFHTCPKMHFLTAPLVAKGVAAKVEIRRPEDYVAGASIQYDGDGRPVQSVVTTRDGGTDAVVYPGVATAGASVNEAKEELDIARE